MRQVRTFCSHSIPFTLLGAGFHLCFHLPLQFGLRFVLLPVCNPDSVSWLKLYSLLFLRNPIFKSSGCCSPDLHHSHTDLESVPGPSPSGPTAWLLLNLWSWARSRLWPCFLLGMGYTTCVGFSFLI